jgi:hypoxanthine phosphoribosyltransferase
LAIKIVRSARRPQRGCRYLGGRLASDPEVVLGIAKPGVIPGVVIASILQRDFASMALTRHEPGAPPQLVAGPPASIRGRDILLVDETCNSGDTLKLALNEVLALNPKEVRTAVSFRTGSYEPDFYAFETDKVILLPWDREIIEGDLREPSATRGSHRSAGAGRS